VHKYFLKRLGVLVLKGISGILRVMALVTILVTAAIIATYTIIDDARKEAEKKC
jgi:hypothetical protein